MSVAVGSIRLAATSSPTVLPVAPAATAAACCDLDSWTARITKRLTRHTRAVVLEASLMIDLLSGFISLIVRAHYSTFACIRAIHAGPRGETSLARRHSEKPRMIRAVACADILLFVLLLRDFRHVTYYFLFQRSVSVSSAL